MVLRLKTLSGLMLALMAGNTFALGLGEIDLRSYLGQPLDARIPVMAGPDEALDDGCFKLVNGAVTSDTGHSTPAKLTFQQVGRNNILQIRSSSAVPEPAVRIQIEASCGNLSRVSREYTLLLDPPEYAATRNNAVAKPIVLPQAVIAQPAASAPVAEIFTQSDASITGINNAPIDATALATPPTRQAGRIRPRAAAPVARAPSRVAPRAFVPPPVARKPVKEKEIEPPAEKMPPAPPVASMPRKEITGDGFRLKLSSAEMNMAPTKTATETDRQRMRARQLLLETQSDDQTATILAMKNSLKVMEAQLAELRRQMAEKNGAPVGNVVGMPDIAEKPVAPSIAPPAAAPEVAPVEPPKAAQISIPVAKPLPAKPAATAEAEALPDWTMPAAAAGLATVLLIGGGLLWRRKKKQPYHDLYADDSVDKKLPIQSVGQFDENKLFEDAEPAEPELEDILQEEAQPVPPVIKAEVKPILKPLEMPAASRAAEQNRGSIDTQAPDSFKMAYLRERFPEIAQGSLRLDKPDSLIQAARLYYQEDNNSAKAAELLEYAIGEYPNEVRPWLAVFEIYRLENRTIDFANLAVRFKKKFEHGGYWPKVQAIGRQIEPQNPMYVAEEFKSDVQDPEVAAISAEAENWLNAPLDFTQDLLGNELRDALLSEDILPLADSATNKSAAKPGDLSLVPDGKKPV